MGKRREEMTRKQMSFEKAEEADGGEVRRCSAMRGAIVGAEGRLVGLPKLLLGKAPGGRSFLGPLEA